MRKAVKKSLVGFFPLTFNLAETGRAILVAKRHIELGGKAVFFSHGGKYEHLIEDFGFDIVKVSPTFTDEVVKEIVSINRGEKKGIPYTESFLREAVREEIVAFKKTDVKMIVSFVNPCCSATFKYSFSFALPLYSVCVPDRFSGKPQPQDSANEGIPPTSLI